MLVFILAAGLAVAPASDAPNNPPHRSNPIYKPTKAQPVEKSLQQLLDEGYVITSMSSGISFVGLILNKDKSWIFCSIESGEGKTSELNSNCALLN
jgi:hypothetical protein